MTRVNKLSEGSPNILDLIRTGEAQFVVNTLTKGKTPERDGFRIRREAVENGVVCHDLAGYGARAAGHAAGDALLQRADA